MHSEAASVHASRLGAEQFLQNSCALVYMDWLRFVLTGGNVDREIYAEFLAGAG